MPHRWTSARVCSAALACSLALCSTSYSTVVVVVFLDPVRWLLCSTWNLSMSPTPNPVFMPEFKPLCAAWEGHQGLFLPNFPHPIPLTSHGRSELPRVLCSLYAASVLPRATLPSPGSSTQSTVCLSLKTLFLSYLLEETFPPCPRTQAPGLSPRLPCTHTPTLLAF